MELILLLRACLTSAVVQHPIQFFLVLLIATIMVMHLITRAGKNKMPPGPTPLPLIGNLHLLIGQKTVDVYRRLARKYGDVFALKLGPTRVVVLNSYDVIKEALLKEGNSFSGRPIISSLKSSGFPTNAGVIFSEGERWKSNRRFSLRHLRDFGVGKRSFEVNITREIELFLVALQMQNGKAFNIHSLLSNAVSNVICCLVFGKRHEYDNKEFKQLIELINENASIPSVIALLPFLAYCPGVRGLVTKRRQNVAIFKSIISRHLVEHEDNFDAQNSPANLIDTYLHGKRGILESVNNVDEIIFEDEQIIKTVFDFFIAGTETTTTTLRWALLYVVTHPVVQDKVRAEIDRVIGTGRKPTLNDKNELHYTQAVLMEVQRIGNTVFMSLPHKTSCDVNFRGYDIPADTIVIPNLFAVHMNEQEFPNPTQFHPERFLDSRGNFDKTMAEKIIPFGLGKRSCLGESLAKMELFLFFTSMMQQFVFKLPDGAPEPSFEGSAGLTNSPKPFKLSAFQR